MFLCNADRGCALTRSAHVDRGLFLALGVLKSGVDLDKQSSDETTVHGRVGTAFRN